nr:MAG TPA: hypothetical protein [Caudoviricetes sp.]
MIPVLIFINRWSATYHKFKAVFREYRLNPFLTQSNAVTAVLTQSCQPA